MANERIFTVKINGLDVAYTATNKLVDALNQLNDKQVNINATSKANTEASKSKKIALTDEEKEQRRLEQTLARIQRSNSDLARQQASATLQLRERTRELRNEAREQNASANSIEGMRARLASMSNEWRRLDPKSEKFEKLTEQIRKLNDEILDNEKRIGVFGRQVANHPTAGMENQIRSSLGLNNEFATSIMNLSKNAETGATSIGTFMSNAGSSVKAFGKTLLGLMANPIFLAIAGIAGAGMAFKFWYDYNKGIQDATKWTQDFTGLLGDEAKVMRNEIQGVADIFGKDFREVLMTSNTLAKQFGISQQEAMDIVKDGFLTGADTAGQFLGSIKKYSPAFKEAGITADEFIAITSQNLTSGIFGDKGLDAITQSTQKIREMSNKTASALEGIGFSVEQVKKDLESGTKTTFDIVREISARLGELPANSEEVGKALKNIFGSGKDAGLQFITSLKDIDANLETVKEGGGLLLKLEEERLNANIELQNVMTALFDQTGGTFETLTTKVQVFATKGLAYLIREVIRFVNESISMYNSLTGGIDYVSARWTQFSAVIGAVFSYIMENAKIVGSALSAAFSLDFDALSAAYDRWGNSTVDTIKQTARTATEEFDKAIAESENRKIKPIEIPVNVVPSRTQGKDVGGGITRSLEDETKSPAASKSVTKTVEDRLKAELDLIKKYEDLKAESIADETEKKIAKANISADREISALQKELETEKGLTEKSKEAITESILLIEEKRAKEIDKINLERSKKIVEDQKTLLDLQAKQVANFYSDLNSETENSKVYKNGILDVDKTRENLNNVASSLQEYISVLFQNRDETAKYYDELSKLYDEDSIEFKKVQSDKEQALRGFDSQIKDANDKLTENVKTNTDAQAEYIKNLADKIGDVTSKIASSVGDAFNILGDILQNSVDDAKDKFDKIAVKYDEIADKREESQNRINELEEEAKNARGGRGAILQQQITAEMETNKKLADQEKKLAKDKEKAQAEITKKERNAKKAEIVANIASGISSTALAVIKAISLSPLTVGLPWSALIAATGALQVGVMASQLTKLEDGGLLSGKRHSQGGMRIQGSNIEVEGGEYVVNREATRKNIGLLSYLNDTKKEIQPTDFKNFMAKSTNFQNPMKKVFESGGKLPIFTSENTENQLLRSIRDIKIESTVSVVDINNAQDSLVRVNELSGL